MSMYFACVQLQKLIVYYIHQSFIIQIIVQLAALVRCHKIPSSLVMNTDQTGIPLVPSTAYTRAEKGAKSVTCNGAGDKRQMTANPTTAADGTMLPLQLIYQGLTLKSLPGGNIPRDGRFKGWQWSVSENHWANIRTTKSHVISIIAPYIKRIVKEGNLPDDQKAVWIIDCWPVCFHVYAIPSCT